jgi:hypothetical protein
MVQTLNLFNIQALNAGENRRRFIQELTSTPISWVVILTVIFLQITAIYFPLFNTLLGTTPIPLIAIPLPIVLSGGMVLFSLKTMKL